MQARRYDPAVTAASAIQVRRLDRLGEAEIAALSAVLEDCVAGGASVSFMHPMTRAKADAFWHSTGESVARGESLVLGAYDEDGMAGTVSLLLKQQENQLHRADLAKMLVHRRARRRGVGALLLAAAEGEARRLGKTLLVLDTASAEAERIYARAGWQRVGEIPGFALWPGGGLCATTIFYKELGGPQPAGATAVTVGGRPAD